VAAEIARIVRQNYYDPRAAESWALKYARYTASADSELKFAVVTKRALAELKTSHTGYYTDRDPEYYALLAIYGGMIHAGDGEVEGIGIDVTPDRFVRVVFAGSPAAEAGLRRGDRILAADGKQFDPFASFHGRAGVTAALKVERAAGQPPITFHVRPRRVKPKQEWLEALEKGSKLIRRNGKAVAYVPMFACAGEEFENALKDQLNSRLRDADALILDFRNGWGGCNPDFVNLFNAAPPVLTSIGRDGKEQQLDGQWRKPLYILINGGSRSGKEAVAYSIKKNKLGTLVGQSTAGAVIAGRAFLLSDRSLLLLAVADIRVDGERLEGHGVAPDVPVADSLPYANGADPQLEKAIDLAARQ